MYPVIRSSFSGQTFKRLFICFILVALYLTDYANFSSRIQNLIINLVEEERIRLWTYSWNKPEENSLLTWIFGHTKPKQKNSSSVKMFNYCFFKLIDSLWSDISILLQIFTIPFGFYFKNHIGACWQNG